MDGAEVGSGTAGPGAPTPRHLGEPRWAKAVAVLTTELLHATLPTQIRALGQVWLYPSVVIGLLVVLIIGDPGRIDKPKPWLRVVTGPLISFIAVVNAACTIYLVDLILTTHARWARRTACSAPEPPCGSSTLLEFG